MYASTIFTIASALLFSFASVKASPIPQPTETVATADSTTPTTVTEYINITLGPSETPKFPPFTYTFDQDPASVTEVVVGYVDQPLAFAEVTVTEASTTYTTVVPTTV
ncbi:unnamed protein product [Ambrosiozyma monospora]|uniref:Unnamed protein product n=1 Tax=Ambrosiozyma monospora TaxID=43982 RepID=A0ACB5SUA5_AMBMO|nr:unnamed protein product [Ambrosiozyma monospora]